MRRAHGGALLLSWGIFSAAFGMNACESDVGLRCTQIGCTTGETLVFTMPKPTASEVRVEACRNGQCWQAQLPANPEGQGQFLPFEEDGTWRATLRLRVDPSSWNITAEFPLQNYSDVVAGDVLKLTFTDADGKQLHSVTGTSSAPTDSYPNGPNCEPSPCRQATAELSEP